MLLSAWRKVGSVAGAVPFRIAPKRGTVQEAVKTQYNNNLSVVDAAVDSLFPSALSLLEQMIRVNSVTPNFYTIKREDVIGGETLCSRMLGEWLAPAVL